MSAPPIFYRKPAVLAGLPLDDHAVIEASAGTGKTYTLEHLYIELLLRGATVDQILVVTFTEKATTELRYRVRSKLEEMVSAGPEADAGDLPPEQVWRLDDGARARLLQALQSFDAAVIATIHAFCQRVLTEHAFANRQLFTLEQVDRRHAFSVAFKEALRGDFARNERPRRYLRAALSSGVDVEQLEDRLYACAIAPGRLEPSYSEAALVAALQGAPVALFEDQEAIGKSLKRSGVDGRKISPILKRLEALAPLLVRHFDHQDPARFLQEFEELSDGSTYKKSGMGVLEYVVNNLQEATLEGVGERMFLAVTELARTAVPLLPALAHEFLPGVLQRLRRRKRELGHYDFDDMLSLVRDSLFGPGGDQLAAALRQRYRFALIDEFQDTDEIQWGIFRRIFFESDRRNLMFLIGDPKQAIYGFRGADVHTYVKARDELRQAGGKVLVLEENFRSTPELIDAYNAILDQRAPAPFFSGVIRYDHPVRCGDPRQRALDLDNQPLPPIHLLVGGGAISPAMLLRKLGRRIAQEIRRLTSAEAPLLFWHRAEGPRAVGLRDIFLLTFSRREGMLLGECLREAGIPHSFYKQDGLFETEEAAHVLDMLVAIDDPHDPEKRLRAWLSPFFGLAFEDAHRCRDLPAEHPLLARLHAFHGLARDKRYERLFAALLEESGLLRRVLLLGGERQVTNYLHLFELLLEELGRARCSLRELCSTLRAYVEGRRSPPGENPGVQRLESDQPAVQIMTMHKAKGLEAAVVFVAGGLARPRVPSLVESYHRDGERRSYIGGGQPPAVKEAIAREEQQEDERLLYVALTRARARLYLPYVPLREPKDKGLKLDGAYACVNARLDAMLKHPAGPGPAFQIEVLDDAPPPSLLEPSPTSIPAWVTPEDAFIPRSTERELEEIRATRGGRFATSYTAMQKGHVHEEATREADQTGEVAPELIRGENDLPGGAATGIFLHGIIETLDFSTLAGAPPLEPWRSLPEVRRCVDQAARTHGIDPRYLPHAEQMIHTSLTSTIALGDRGELAGFGGLERRLCEVEFLFPLPEPPRAGPLDEEGRIRHDEGYVKGFIDFLFEHQGRLYFADWKSDGLRSFVPSFLGAHVHKNYPRQLQLYSLALVRMLGVRDEAAFEERFGGLLYVFLRGTGRGNGEGFYFWRPDWAQILRWEQDLQQFRRNAA
jgi:exodeoxyribonuclease V beta subunit